MVSLPTEFGISTEAGMGPGIARQLTVSTYFGGGLTGAVPVTGDWTGTGTTKIGVYHNGIWYLDLSGNGAWDGTPTDALYYFGGGLPGAVPVTGDWTGTGATKIGVYHNGVWYLDLNGNGVVGRYADRWSLLLRGRSDRSSTGDRRLDRNGRHEDRCVSQWSLVSRFEWQWNLGRYADRWALLLWRGSDWSGTGDSETGRERVPQGLAFITTEIWYVDLNGNGMWDGTPTDGLYYFGGGLTGAVPVASK